MEKIVITTFYKFVPFSEKEMKNVQARLNTFGTSNQMLGLTLLALEGVNGTVSGSQKTVEAFKKELQEIIDEVQFKDSTASESPFKRWFVKIRKEIVAIGDPELHPKTQNNNHLTPDEWNAMLENEDVVLLDTRNDYETMIGTFKGAIDPNLETFDEFPGYVAQCDIPKDKKVLMFCTGGIRCEKASLEMQRQGYKHVYQLKGGILQYFKEHPSKHFEGECFVFDHRGAVDQNLEPSKRYVICCHCGDPGDNEITCKFCDATCKICNDCKKVEIKNTCSKDHRGRLERKLAKEAKQAH